MIWYVLIFISIFILGEFLHASGMKADYTRKLVHILSGVTIASMPFFLPPAAIIFTGCVFSLGMYLLYQKKILKGIDGVPYETVGGPLFPLGLTAASVITIKNPAAFQAAVLIVTIADPVIWFVFTRTKLRSADKTMAGSMMFGMIALVIWLAMGFGVGDVSPGFFVSAIIAASIIALAEHHSLLGSDNLFVPVIAAAVGTVFL